MNNRQKAKHFKQLYEKTLAQKYYPEVIKIESLKHCSVSAGFSPDLIINEPDQELITNLVIKKITDQMKPIIKDHVITWFDNIMGVYRVSFDFWVKEAAGVKNNRKVDYLGTAKIKNDMADIGKELRIRFDKYKAESETQ